MKREPRITMAKEVLSKVRQKPKNPGAPFITPLSLVMRGYRLRQQTTALPPPVHRLALISASAPTPDSMSDKRKGRPKTAQRLAF
jgi:hypothetical protein